MNTFVIKRYIFALLCISTVIGLTSCGNDEPGLIVIPDEPNNNTITLSGYGTFLAINRTTNDTLRIEENTYVYPAVINATSGDTISMSFTPWEEYKNDALEIIYTLHDQTKIEGQFVYDYVLKDVSEGVYQLYVTLRNKKEDIVASTTTFDIVLNLKE